MIRIPPAGMRGSSMPAARVLRVLSKPFFKREVARLEDPTATEQRKFMGFPVGVLTTVGSKTGQERKHVLGVFPDGKDAWLVIASNGGSAKHPRWFINVATNPDKVWLQVANRRMRAHVESLQGRDREDAYARVVAVARNYGSYPKKTDREIPVLRLTPAG